MQLIANELNKYLIVLTTFEAEFVKLSSQSFNFFSKVHSFTTSGTVVWVTMVGVKGINLSNTVIDMYTNEIIVFVQNYYN